MPDIKEMPVYGSDEQRTGYAWFELPPGETKAPEIDLLNIDMSNLPEARRDDRWMYKAHFVKV